MKKEYFIPEMYLLKVNCNDIIATSNIPLDDGEPDDDNTDAQ